MNDESLCFLKCIEHCPYDSDLRLVYSDWLEERGLPKEASRQRQLSDMIRCEKAVFAARISLPIDELSSGSRKIMEKDLNEKVASLLDSLSPGTYTLDIGPVSYVREPTFHGNGFTHIVHRVVHFDKKESVF
jgi:uncharacterized protein (TIGR02996 family)